MLKLFISQPMRGKTNEEIETERKSILEKFSGYEEIKSFFKDRPEVQSVPLFCLGDSLKLLATADLAVFAEGWEEARGCIIEHDCCKAYGIPYVEMGEKATKETYKPGMSKTALALLGTLDELIDNFSGFADIDISTIPTRNDREKLIFHNLKQCFSGCETALYLAKAHICAEEENVSFLKKIAGTKGEKA